MNWSATGGSIRVDSDNLMTYTASETPGEYTITATLAEDGGVSASATVHVTAPPRDFQCSDVFEFGDGATIQGDLPGVRIVGDVTVTGRTNICGDLIITRLFDADKSGSLALGGHRVEVEGDFVQAQGALVMVTGDPLLRVHGNTFVGGTGTQLSAGRIEARGEQVLINGLFPATGTHRMVLNGTVAQFLFWQCRTGCSHTIPASGMFFNDLEFSNPAGVTLTNIGGPAFQIRGNVTIREGAVQAHGDVHLHGDLIDEVGGRWQNSEATVILGAEPRLPARLTSSRIFIGSRHVSDTTRTTLQGDLEVVGILAGDGAGASLTLNGHTLRVTGDLHTQLFGSVGTIIMDRDADRLIVNGNATFAEADSLTGAHFSAGRFEPAGNMTVRGNGFRATGTHTTIFNGAAAQTVTMSCDFTDCGTHRGAVRSRFFRDIEIANEAGVTFNGAPPVITGTFLVPEDAAASFTASGVLDGSLDLHGTLTVPANSTVNIDDTLFLRDTSVLNNSGIMEVNECEKEDGHTINGTDPC